MIIGYIGKMRSGKTLSITKQAYHYHKQGKTIMSNYHLNFNYIPLDINELDKAIRTGDTKFYDNKVILIDEIHTLIDSRTSGHKRNRIISYFLTQSGKADNIILWSSQFLRQVDVRLRMNTIFIKRSTRYKKIDGKLVIMRQNEKGKDFYVKLEHFELCDTYRGLSLVRRKTTYYKPSETLLNLYDTSEKIHYQEYKEEEIKKGGKK